MIFYETVPRPSFRIPKHHCHVIAFTEIEGGENFDYGCRDFSPEVEYRLYPHWWGIDGIYIIQVIECASTTLLRHRFHKRVYHPGGGYLTVDMTALFDNPTDKFDWRTEGF